jgi:hypothetical protein
LHALQRLRQKLSLNRRLILRCRLDTEDHELLALHGKAANDKARVEADSRNTRSYRGLVGGLVSPPKMPAPAVARDALAMATPVTDSVSPYRALKRQPTASLFFQGIVCSRANRDRSRQRCRLSIPGEEKCECGYGNNGQFAHDGPLFLRRCWERTYSGEENELKHSLLGGNCKREERRPKPTPPLDNEGNETTYLSVTVPSLPSPVPPWNRRSLGLPRPGLLHARKTIIPPKEG